MKRKRRFANTIASSEGELQIASKKRYLNRYVISPKTLEPMYKIIKCNHSAIHLFIEEERLPSNCSQSEMLELLYLLFSRLPLR